MAMITPNGWFEPVTAPFGLMGPSYFQMLMSTHVLNGMDTVGRDSECFIDDVVMLPTSRHCRCRGGLGRCSAELISRIRALELAGG